MQRFTNRRALAAGEPFGTFLCTDHGKDKRGRMVYVGDPTLTFKVTPHNETPLASLSASRTSAAVGENVTFTATLSDPDAASSNSPFPFEYQLKWFMTRQ